MDTLIKTVEKKIETELIMVEHYQKESDKYLQFKADAKANAETLQLELANLQKMVKKEEPETH